VVEGGLRQAALAAPELALARHEPAADEAVEEGRAHAPGLDEVLVAGGEDVLDVVGVEEEERGDVEEARRHHVAELARAALDEPERVAVELAHVAHQTPAARAPGDCCCDHDEPQLDSRQESGVRRRTVVARTLRPSSSTSAARGATDFWLLAPDYGISMKPSPMK
jgi:hypothetical protein